MSRIGFLVLHPSWSPSHSLLYSVSLPVLLCDSLTRFPIFLPNRTISISELQPAGYKGVARHRRARVT